MLTVVTGLAVAFIVPASPAQATPGDGYRRLRNVATGHALVPRVYTSGVAVQQERVSPTNLNLTPLAGQDWLLQIDQGYARFRNKASGDTLALTVRNSVAGLSRPVIAYTNDPGNPAQLWSVTQVPGAATGVFQIRNPASNRCLSIPNGDTTPGVQAITYPCNNAPDQWWRNSDDN